MRIITFYRGQVALLKKKLAQKEMEGILVGTVDAPQGCEADVVIISFVRSGASARFLTDNRRMNVSLTQAKHQLICIGNISQFPFMKDADTLHSLANNTTARNVVVKAGGLASAPAKHGNRLWPAQRLVRLVLQPMPLTAHTILQEDQDYVGSLEY